MNNHGAHANSLHEHDILENSPQRVFVLGLSHRAPLRGVAAIEGTQNE